ncbi:SDR family NAD(P)-dependent oxidoreductase [Corallococcus exiguus]|uniref:SDR family NAD(P)-dependent oxidoreductase n=1 Tax=Corallococcus exiguus TaxID=83462 RepID=UPI00345861C0
MAERMRLQGRTAVVTGAASGIGRAIAVCLARKGCHLALADVNEAGLAETADLASAPELRISRHRLDVSDKEAVEAFPEKVKAEHPGVDLLFNNAGVALGGSFEQVSSDDFEWLFGINFWGVVRLSRAFLPLLRQSDDARLVNLSSVFGLVAPPGQVAYAASKFAVRGFSEGLRHELEGTTVGVTVVHPGGVATSIAASARVPTGATAEEVTRRRKSFQKMLRLPAEAAGDIIVRGVEAREQRILVGKDAVALAMLARVFPVSYWKLLASRLRS